MADNVPVYFFPNVRSLCEHRKQVLPRVSQTINDPANLFIFIDYEHQKII
jgi:hypothetical protein